MNTLIVKTITGKLCIKMKKLLVEVGDIFRNDEIDHTNIVQEIFQTRTKFGYKYELEVLIIRNGFSGIHTLNYDKAIESWLNPELYTKITERDLTKLIIQHNEVILFKEAIEHYDMYAAITQPMELLINKVLDNLDNVHKPNLYLSINECELIKEITDLYSEEYELNMEEINLFNEIKQFINNNN